MFFTLKEINFFLSFQSKPTKKKLMSLFWNEAVNDHLMCATLNRVSNFVADILCLLKHKIYAYVRATKSCARLRIFKIFACIGETKSADLYLSRKFKACLEALCTRSDNKLDAFITRQNQQAQNFWHRINSNIFQLK